MTRKDYVLIGEIIRNNTIMNPQGDDVLFKDEVIKDLCYMFKLDNPNFKRDKFIEFVNS